jgi:hypothetical protein
MGNPTPTKFPEGPVFSMYKRFADLGVSMPDLPL